MNEVYTYTHSSPNYSLIDDSIAIKVQCKDRCDIYFCSRKILSVSKFMENIFNKQGRKVYYHILFSNYNAEDFIICLNLMYDGVKIFENRFYRITLDTIKAAQYLLLNPSLLIQKYFQNVRDESDMVNKFRLFYEFLECDDMDVMEKRKMFYIEAYNFLGTKYKEYIDQFSKEYKCEYYRYVESKENDTIYINSTSNIFESDDIYFFPSRTLNITTHQLEYKLETLNYTGNDVYVDIFFTDLYHNSPLNIKDINGIFMEDVKNYIPSSHNLLRDVIFNISTALSGHLFQIIVKIKKEN